MRIFLMISICVLLITNTTIGQDKKILENVGVYFRPMYDVNDYKLYYDGWNTGFRSNIKINDKFSFDCGIGYGILNYKNCFERFEFNFWIGRPAQSIKSKTLRIDPKLRYTVFNSVNNNNFYIFGGSVFNINFYEIYELYKYYSVNAVLENKTIHLHNVLFDIGLGYSYYINTNILLDIEISLGIPLWFNHHKGGGFYVDNAHPYNINGGISLGLFYKW